MHMWGTTHFGVVLTQELEVLAKLKGDTKGFCLLKGGGGAQQVVPSLDWVHKKF